MACHVLQHPLAAHHLSLLRAEETTPAEFRRALRQLATLLAVEASNNLPTCSVEVRTPLCATTGAAISVRIGIVPILRAGLGMVEPLLDLIPTAEVWHLGLYRDEVSAQPVEYYSQLPDQRPVDIAFVLDPMLATGGSATLALEALQRWGVREIRLLSVIAAEGGLERVVRAFPNTALFVCAVDAELNDRKFIVPGLGDAGDRTFNTQMG
ncbi:MAG: uracil phosphoribosyltransferase [Planctomycetaceae bacterium]